MHVEKVVDLVTRNPLKLSLDDGGRRRGLRRSMAAVAMECRGGGLPAAIGRGGRPWELREDVRKVVVRSILA